ncbi:MAG TPA: glycosyltransferase family 4 protein [Sedimentisphaerales bacterium]|jgi:glycosyltransferase involved in cell wall biosynthesis|nr:glycosyltransferase family 4 protein [Sedimentisphaerales bacterium]HNU30691.1 glycosyltransferase family 4 protein [Sedimentisphaerales bacterium]
MKIIQICPGSGDNFYCENCLRDAALVKALRGLGHDVLMVPLYLPLQADKVEPVSNAPLFFGGVNVYLQQKLSLFRKTPRWIDRWFDSRGLLEWAGRKAGMTSARDLGETTISMLQGEHGRQVKELDRFVDWLVTEPEKPDVVCLSNVLLAGMARRIKERLAVPVVCLLQDEDGFLDGLTSPYAERAWAVVRERARDIDAFLAVSQYYADAMQERLQADSSRMHVVHMGVEMGMYTPGDSGPVTPTIGFLSRMCPQRGLETLIDAFLLLKRNSELGSAKLRISGGRSAADEPFISRLRDKLAAAGVLDDVEFLAAFDRDARLEFLRGLSVLSVPEASPVAYGLYVLEALAMGVPVVEPAIGCFPEVIALTGGGILYEPNTPERLAEVLEPLLLDSQAARKLGAEGRAGMLRAFDIARTAKELVGVYERVVRR